MNIIPVSLVTELSSEDIVTILKDDSSDAIFSVINHISDCNPYGFSTIQFPPPFCIFFTSYFVYYFMYCTAFVLAMPSRLCYMNLLNFLEMIESSHISSHFETFDAPILLHGCDIWIIWDSHIYIYSLVISSRDRKTHFGCFHYYIYILQHQCSH